MKEKFNYQATIVRIENGEQSVQNEQQDGCVGLMQLISAASQIITNEEGISVRIEMTVNDFHYFDEVKNIQQADVYYELDLLNGRAFSTIFKQLTESANSPKVEENETVKVVEFNKFNNVVFDNYDLDVYAYEISEEKQRGNRVTYANEEIESTNEATILEQIKKIENANREKKFDDISTFERQRSEFFYLYGNLCDYVFRSNYIEKTFLDKCQPFTNAIIEALNAYDEHHVDDEYRQAFFSYCFQRYHAGKTTDYINDTQLF